MATILELIILVEIYEPKQLKTIISIVGATNCKNAGNEIMEKNWLDVIQTVEEKFILKQIVTPKTISTQVMNNTPKMHFIKEALETAV